MANLIWHEILCFDYFAAVKIPTACYHQMEFEEKPLEIYLETKQVEGNTAERQNTYLITTRNIYEARRGLRCHF